MKILLFFLYLLFIGAVLFIPDLVVDRFHVAPYLWLGGIVGLLSILLAVTFYGKELPCLPFFLTVLGIVGILYALYYFAFNLVPTIQLLIDCIVFIISYSIFSIMGIYRPFYLLLIIIGMMVAMIGLFQYFGLFHSFHSSFLVVGPFDNPAGISIFLASLSPFFLFFIYEKKRGMFYAILGFLLISTVVILSESRTAVFSVFVVLSYCVYKYFSFKRHQYVVCWIALMGILLVIALFYLKPDSANGRLLIWRCCLDLIGLHPYTGAGYGSFRGHYMPEQANFLFDCQSLTWKQLASNVFHPFNEYLKILIEQGLVGFLLVGSIFTSIIRFYRKYKTQEKEVAFLSLIVIGICAFFSYPMEYPVIRLLTAFLVGILLSRPMDSSAVKYWRINKSFLILSLICSVVLIGSISYQFYYEMRWKKLVDVEDSFQNGEYIDSYRLLYNETYLHSKPAFIYSYSVALNEEEMYEESNAIINENLYRLNDYDIQLLQAYNYLKLGKLDSAQIHFHIASNMIPNRFVPLYELFKIYKKKGRLSDARREAMKIANKPVKVMSPKIVFIKRDVNNYLSNH